VKASTAYFGLFILILSLSACSNSGSDVKTAASRKDANTSTYKYTADVANTALHWTAYKFTEKLGVSGVFDDFSVEEQGDSGTIEELLEGTKMTIATASVNSNNEVRDMRLRTNFFGVLNSEFISVKILSAKAGKGELQVTMNNRANKLDYGYSLKRDTLFLRTNLNLMLWDGKEAMDSLNQVCHDLHKGADGISKLWPDVDVTFTLPLRLAL
jgi:polyisoprenoid-binding protein YceI